MARQTNLPQKEQDMNEQVLNFNDLPSALSLVISKLKELDEKFTVLISQIKPSNEQVWLTVSELKEYLPTHPVEHTIYCWTSNQEIPFHKRGKRIMFLKSEIDDWLQENKSRSRTEIMKEAFAYVQSKRKTI